MHEEPRNHLRSEVGRLIDAARGAGALHACWSGAGPSVLALAETENVPKVRAAFESNLEAGKVLELRMAASGLQ
jgi:homoserine kinase